MNTKPSAFLSSENARLQDENRVLKAEVRSLRDFLQILSHRENIHMSPNGSILFIIHFLQNLDELFGHLLKSLAVCFVDDKVALEDIAFEREPLSREALALMPYL